MEAIRYGELIMRADTREVLGPVIRATTHWLFYRKEPTQADVRQWAKVTRRNAMRVKQ